MAWCNFFKKTFSKRSLKIIFQIFWPLKPFDKRIKTEILNQFEMKRNYFLTAYTKSQNIQL